VPERYKAGLHVSFIGGLSLLTLALAATWCWGTGSSRRKGPLALATGVTAGCLLLAIVPRALMDFDPERFFLWMGVAAGAFLLGSGSWPCMYCPGFGRRRRRPRCQEGYLKLRVE